MDHVSVVLKLWSGDSKGINDSSTECDVDIQLIIPASDMPIKFNFI